MSKHSIERKLIKQKLWEDSEFAVEESLLGMAMINRGLIVLEQCQAILRRDYDNMPGKVRHFTFLNYGISGDLNFYAVFQSEVKQNADGNNYISLQKYIFYIVEYQNNLFATLDSNCKYKK